jgi:hypothetical protein
MLFAVVTAYSLFLDISRMMAISLPLRFFLCRRWGADREHEIHDGTGSLTNDNAANNGHDGHCISFSSIWTCCPCLVVKRQEGL